MKMQNERNPPQFAAHTPPKDDPKPFQTMFDHSKGVADRAEIFGSALSPAAAALVRWCGWAHDSGKYSVEFQNYLRLCELAARTGGRAPKPGSVDHKTAGAKLALDTLPPPLDFIAAHCILGHHGGLRGGMGNGLKNIINGNIERDGDFDEALRRALSDLPLEQAKLGLPADPMSVMPPSAPTAEHILTLEMLTRFVFSCLVDADSLDTERYRELGKSEMRRQVALGGVLEEWIAALETHIAKLAGKDQSDDVRTVRAQVHTACKQARTVQPGVFTLAVPTGGGKTYSSLAFALGHARTHDLQRIIYVIPYTSIIDQTARAFRMALPVGAWVLEHHSAVEPPKLDKASPSDLEGDEQSAETQRRLAAENWDAPLIVTTSVQFFESLFTNRTSRARKLHNFARSVIILDEAQTMPGILLQALVSGLNTLARDFGATIVLCSATQPALAGESDVLRGFQNVRPIVDNAMAQEHFAKMKRVKFEVQPEKWTWEQLAEKITSFTQSSLTVLNTKKDALGALKAVRERLPEGQVYHLSTLLCGAHRKTVIDAFTEALSLERDDVGSPARLISTQIVECGVDLDAPRVYRARGPLDRLIQAAGRCNRSGLRQRENSNVIIFDPAEGSRPGGTYAIECNAAETFLEEYLAGRELDDPDVPVDYFRLVYRRMEKFGLDEKEVQSYREKFDYPEVAKRVRLIEDDTLPVLCRYDEQAEKLADTIADNVRRGFGLTRDLWRSLQPYTVAIRASEQARLQGNGKITPLVPDALYEWIAPYDALLGIGGEGGVVYDPADLMAGESYGKK